VVKYLHSTAREGLLIRLLMSMLTRSAGQGTGYKKYKYETFIMLMKTSPSLNELLVALPLAVDSLIHLAVVPSESSLLTVARRNLFVAYCHSDMSTNFQKDTPEFSHYHAQASQLFESAINFARMSLNYATTLSFIEEANTLVNDAYTEWIMHLEDNQELTEARRVACLAPAHNNGLQAGSAGWQRAGQMHCLFVEDSSVDLAAKGWWDKSQFDFVAKLKENWKIIRAELQSNMQVEGRLRKVGWHGNTEDHKIVDEGGDWSEVVLFGRGEEGWKAPKTVELITKICPQAVDLCQQGGGEIIFSVLRPGTHIKPHCATTNFRLTCHLGLIVPDSSSGKCEIRVGEEWRKWEEGKSLIFDDSFEHEVVNFSSEARGILLLRFWHPALQGEEKRGMREFLTKAARENRERQFERRWDFVE